MLINKKPILFILLTFCYLVGNGQILDSSSPIGMSTDTIIVPRDTLPAKLDSIPVALDTTNIKIDSTSIRKDSTHIGARRPPARKKKPVAIIETNEVFYFYPDNPEKIIQFTDTLISTRFFQYDPARSGAFDYATLGAVGGPMLPLFYQWEDRSGNRAGIDVFEPYIKYETDIKFFTKSKAFSDFYYSQGTEQNDHVFHGEFGRSFDNGIKLSVTHDRLIHSLNTSALPLNGQAFFPFPSAKNTSFLAGLAFQKPGNNYQAFVTYAHNEINQLYNGGIDRSDPVIPVADLFDIIQSADTLDVGVSIPSAIEEESARLRFRMRAFALSQSFTLVGKNDSTAVTSRVFNIDHKVKYTSDLYRFSDTAFNEEYYGNLATDDRGARVVLNQNAWNNYFGLNTVKLKDGVEVPSILGDIRLGIRHQYARFDGEGYERIFNNVFAEGSWKINPIAALTLDVFGQVGVLDNIGDFRLKATAELQLGKLGILQGLIRQQRYSPSEYAQQNFVTQVPVWNNNFDKSFNSELGFKYLLPKQKLEAGLSYFLLDNHVYYDDSLNPAQKSGAINLLQLYLKKDFKWNIFHLENVVMVQQSTDEVIQLPDWWSRHSLYAQRKIFNNIMLARLGFDLRLNAPYFANGFNPALGQFFTQQERAVDLYPALDVHFGFVVETFRIFLKMENISSLLTTDVFYQVPYYPQKELAFRFGLSWRFLDQNSNKKSSDESNENTGQRSGSGAPINLPRL